MRITNPPFPIDSKKSHHVHRVGTSTLQESGLYQLHRNEIPAARLLSPLYHRYGSPYINSLRTDICYRSVCDLHLISQWENTHKTTGNIGLLIRSDDSAKSKHFSDASAPIRMGAFKRSTCNRKYTVLHSGGIPNVPFRFINFASLTFIERAAQFSHTRAHSPNYQLNGC
jgi:hypothetical protein